MNRVAVVGTAGSGKTTVAAALAERLGSPHIELDRLYWGPNWTGADEETFRSRVREAISADRWVCDGNYAPVRPMVLASADTAVWLDLPLWTCLQRIVARTFRRARSRQPLFGTDNRESWRHQLGRDSLIWWVLTTHRRRRREYAARFADPAYAHLHVVRLQSTGAVASWLQRLDPIAVGSASVESSEIERCAE